MGIGRCCARPNASPAARLPSWMETARRTSAAMTGAWIRNHGTLRMRLWSPNPRPTRCDSASTASADNKRSRLYIENVEREMSPVGPFCAFPGEKIGRPQSRIRHFNHAPDRDADRFARTLRRNSHPMRKRFGICRDPKKVTMVTGEKPPANQRCALATKPKPAQGHKFQNRPIRR